MEKKQITARSIALMGILIAMQVVLSRWLSIPTQFVKISFAFIPVVFMAMTFSPLLAGVGNGFADFIGASLFPSGPFFPGFTLTAFLAGVIYSSFYYKKEMTLKRIILANVTVTVFMNLILNTLWLYIMFGSSALAFIPARLISSSIMLVVQVTITYSMSNVKVLQQQLVKF